MSEEPGTLIRQGLGEIKGPGTSKRIWERIKYYRDTLKKCSVVICTKCGMGVINWHDLDTGDYHCFCINGQCDSKKSRKYKDPTSTFMEKIVRGEAVFINNQLDRFSKIRLEQDLEKRICEVILE